MVILEMLAGAYILNEHNKKKKARRRFDEEQDAIRQQMEAEAAANAHARAQHRHRRRRHSDSERDEGRHRRTGRHGRYEEDDSRPSNDRKGSGSSERKRREHQQQYAPSPLQLPAPTHASPPLQPHHDNDSYEKHSSGRDPRHRHEMPSHRPSQPLNPTALALSSPTELPVEPPSGLTHLSPYFTASTAYLDPKDAHNHPSSDGRRRRTRPQRSGSAPPPSYDYASSTSSLPLPTPQRHDNSMAGYHQQHAHRPSPLGTSPSYPNRDEHTRPTTPPHASSRITNPDSTMYLPPWQEDLPPPAGLLTHSGVARQGPGAAGRGGGHAAGGSGGGAASGGGEGSSTGGRPLVRFADGLDVLKHPVEAEEPPPPYREY